MPPLMSVARMSDKSPGLTSPFETALAICGADASVPTAAFIRFTACANLRNCMMTCKGQEKGGGPREGWGPVL